MFFTLPFSKSVFILTSPPQEQKNFCVVTVVRLFLLAWAMMTSPCPRGDRYNILKENTIFKASLSIERAGTKTMDKKDNLVALGKATGFLYLILYYLG